LEAINYSQAERTAGLLFLE